MASQVQPPPPLLIRYNSDGSMDTSFQVAHTPRTAPSEDFLDATGHSNLAATGWQDRRRRKIVAVNNVPRPGLVHLNDDGTVDQGFVPDAPANGYEGSTPTIYGLASTGNKLIVTGDSTNFGNLLRRGVVQLESNPVSIAPPMIGQPQAVDGGIEFSVQTRPGVTYHFEFSEAVAPALWYEFQTATGNGPTKQISYSLANAMAGFYRVRLTAP